MRTDLYSHFPPPIPANHIILGAKEVVVTDLPELVGIMEENVRLNDLPNCRAAALTWGDDPAPFNPPFDIILLADVVRTHFVSTEGQRRRKTEKLTLRPSFAL